MLYTTYVIYHISYIIYHIAYYVLQFLRDSGFTAEVVAPKLPRGLRKGKNGKVIVCYEKPGGSIGYHTCEDLDAALAWQSDKLQQVAEVGEEIEAPSAAARGGSESEPAEAADPLDAAQEAAVARLEARMRCRSGRGDSDAAGDRVLDEAAP